MQKDELHFISRLPNYTIKHTLIRIVLVGLMGAIFLYIAASVAPGAATQINFDIYIRVILVFIILTECNIFFDNFSERFLPIPDRIKTRIFFHLFISVIIGLLAIKYFEQLTLIEDILQQKIAWIMLALGFLFVFILIMFSIGLRITEKWIYSLKEIELLKQAKLKSDYNSLQEQLNPHFLFNNLSVLKSMIIYDPKAAVKFTQNFTDVYRYVLQSSKKTTVKLKEEIEFIYSYLGVHQERLGTALEVKIEVSNEMMEKELPALALQLLVENALKHNVSSKKQPLLLSISAKDNLVKVSNSIHLKDIAFSTHKGLENLILRYEILSEQKVIITTKDGVFCISLPLL